MTEYTSESRSQVYCTLVLLTGHICLMQIRCRDYNVQHPGQLATDANNE